MQPGQGGGSEDGWKGNYVRHIWEIKINTTWNWTLLSKERCQGQL